MSETENQESTADSTSSKKGLKELWNELKPQTQLWLKIVAAVVVGLAVFGVGFTSGYEKAKADVRTALEDAFSGLESEPAPEIVEEEVVEEDAASELGTRSNPAPMGTTVVFSDNTGDLWEVTLSDPILNANDIVAAENQFNDPAPEGFQYAMVGVTAKYIGKATGTPYWDLTISFVSEAGTTHETGDFSAVIPSDLSDINELYADAVGVGNIVIAVPSANVESGNWTVSTGFGSEKYFYVAQ